MSKELVEKRNDLVTRAEEILNKAKEEKRELTEDETKEIGDIKSKVAGIDSTIKLDEEVRAMGKMEVKKEENEKELTKEEQTRALEEKESDDFASYIRNERDANLTKSDNGAVIPTTVANKIIKRVADVSPIVARATKYNVKGNITIPKYDETSGAVTVAYADEFSPLKSNIGKFGQITLTSHLAGALALISVSLLNNTNFNLTNWTVQEFGDKFAQFAEKAAFGDGTVAGLSTLTNKVTAAAATAVTADELIAVQDKVKDVYQKNAIWIMSPATRTAIRQLKDNEGRYILNMDATAAFGSTLFGKPVYVTDGLGDMVTGKPAIYYGDFSGLAMKIAQDVDVQVLREKYADQHAVGVVGWMDFDIQVEDEQKIAALVMA